MADHPVVVSGLAYLEAMADRHQSAMSCAWSILARHAYGQDISKETELLLRAQKTDGSFFGANLMVSGLAATALSAIAGDNPLIISR
jgi:hypothetical protein